MEWKLQPNKANNILKGFRDLRWHLRCSRVRGQYQVKELRMILPGHVLKQKNTIKKEREAKGREEEEKWESVEVEQEVGACDGLQVERDWSWRPPGRNVQGIEIRASSLHLLLPFPWRLRRGVALMVVNTLWMCHFLLVGTWTQVLTVLGNYPKSWRMSRCSALLQ